MNFHTFELYYKLSPTEVSRVKDILWQSPNGAYRETDKGIPTLVSKTLSDYGIVIKIKQYSQDAYKHNILYYRINPRRMFESG
ncbi:MAG: hypothetical protein IJX57_03910, partial [Clostridia bacterium]|nr:hypothetical protein [Clostridia bacterium]